MFICGKARAGSGLTCSRLASADDLWWHSKLHQFGIHAKSPASDPACDDSFGEFPLVAFGVSIVQSLPHVAESQHAVTGREDFGCAMQDLVLSVISLIIFNYHSTIISWFSMFRCLLHLSIVEFLHRGMQAHLTWGPGLVALVSQLQFTPCKCRHQAATAWNVNFRARGNFNVVPWAEMTTRWHCLLAMLAMHW